MKRASIFRAVVLVALTCATSAGVLAQANKYARDPKQPVDETYTKKIKEYTTEPFFLSPLVDYLPASKTVPTPTAVLGDIAGAPGKLPYTAEVHEYMRMLEKASPGRVRVFSIGKSEEGREMIAVAIAAEPVLARLDENRARLAKLADPRTIKLDDAEADRLVGASVPVYYIAGALHAPETGAPTSLMELAYRLVVDESPYIKAIRSNVITMITPVLETDGRDRQVDIYKWHLANPNDSWPPVAYWGKYIVHDNNRDAMAATLALTRNVIDFVVAQKVQVLHDLHESVPYLYDNTVGDGPYNAWVDPILTDEWQLLGWNNMSEMTKFGMPGAFAHGTFDTWSPGYLMFIGAMHNGISRLYETFGNAGADTVERKLQPNDYARTWYKQNPPLPKTMWSQRNNNNYTLTGLLTALSYFSDNSKLFLKNFYLKSKRSVLKPKVEGPAAYIFTGDDPRPGAQAELLRVLQRQAVEISRATAPFSVEVPAKKAKAADKAGDKPGDKPADAEAKAAGQKPEAKADDKPKTEVKQFPAGSYIVRMDQPYSRIADALLDYRYLEPERSAEAPVRRHRLDVRRAVQRAGGAGDRHESARRRHGAGGRDRGAERHQGHRPGLHRQQRRGPVAAGVQVPDEGRGVRRGRGAVRGGRAEVQPRVVHRAQRAGRRRAGRGAGTGPAGVRRRRGAVREGASGEGAANRLYPHLARHAGRGLVADGIRPPEDPVRLHQHAGDSERGQPDHEMGRAGVPACRPRRAADRVGHADVAQPAAVEDHGAHAEHREDRLDGRYAAGPGLRRCRQSRGLRPPWRRADRVGRHVPVREHVRDDARAVGAVAGTPQRAGHGDAREARRSRESDRVWLWRDGGDLFGARAW